MQKKRLGNSDLELTPIGVGAWAMGGGGWAFAWGPQDDDESISAIHVALDHGVNWIDTAPVYGLGPQLAKTLAMAPWQIDQARRKLSGWDPEGVGRAIQAVAAADFEVKGGGRDPVYAVERAVLTICSVRNPR